MLRQLRQRAKKTEALETSGALVYDIKTNRWKLTCPICKSVRTASSQHNALICRVCNPPKTSTAKSKTYYWNDETDAP